MSITHQFANRFVGKPVMAHCHDGRRHYGILTRVTPQHIHLHPFPNRGVPVSSDSIEKVITTAEQKNANYLDIVETGPGYGYGYGYGRRGYGGYGGYGFGGPGYWRFGAGVVLPLYVLLALSLFWW